MAMNDNDVAEAVVAMAVVVVDVAVERRLQPDNRVDDIFPIVMVRVRVKISIDDYRYLFDSC